LDVTLWNSSTLLMQVASAGDAAAVAQLIAAGANLDLVNSFGRSLFHESPFRPEFFPKNFMTNFSLDSCTKLRKAKVRNFL
jgi:ankyrin repeat protein